MEDLHLPLRRRGSIQPHGADRDKAFDSEDIRLLTPRILNTADELRAVAEALDQQPGARAIVVTSRAHTRRVGALWRKLSPGDRGRLLVRASTEDSFDAAHWWRTSNDALAVVREYLGLLNAWAGLPLSHTK